VFFKANCNEQVFSPKPEKNLTQIRTVIFEKKLKTALTPTHSNCKKITSPSRRL